MDILRPRTPPSPAMAPRHQSTMSLGEFLFWAALVIAGVQEVTKLGDALVPEDTRAALGRMFQPQRQDAPQRTPLFPPASLPPSFAGDVPNWVSQLPALTQRSQPRPSLSGTAQPPDERSAHVDVASILQLLRQPTIDAVSAPTAPGGDTANRSAPTPVSGQRTAPYPEPDARWREVLVHPCVEVILGSRGSGKTALGYRQLELLRDRGAPYAVGLPQRVRHHLPAWVGLADRVEDVPQGAIALVDEAYLSYHARRAMTARGQAIGDVVNLSRQRRQTLIFIVQEARQLDVTEPCINI